MQQGNCVVVIGGANMDIQGFPEGPLVLHDSNPGEVKISPGGVGRNIAENLAKLGAPVKLITALGDDLYGQKIMVEAKEAGIDMSESFVIRDASTSVYLSILNEKGEMTAAISHMDIIERLTASMIMEKGLISTRPKCAS